MSLLTEKSKPITTKKITDKSRMYGKSLLDDQGFFKTTKVASPRDADIVTPILPSHSVLSLNDQKAVKEAANALVTKPITLVSNSNSRLMSNKASF